MGNALTIVGANIERTNIIEQKSETDENYNRVKLIRRDVEFVSIIGSNFSAVYNRGHLTYLENDIDIENPIFMIDSKGHIFIRKYEFEAVQELAINLLKMKFNKKREKSGNKINIELDMSDWKRAKYKHNQITGLISLQVSRQNESTGFSFLSPSFYEMSDADESQNEMDNKIVCYSHLQSIIISIPLNIPVE